jgi:hypothetical protein
MLVDFLPDGKRVQVGLKTPDEAVAITRARAIIAEGVFVKPVKTSLSLVIGHDLYEPEACFVARSGETVVGRDRIRDVLARMIRSKTKLQSWVSMPSP